MKLPRQCPNCDRVTQINMRWVQRTSADLYLGSDKELRDQILECSECHTLFRARYELVSFAKLVEAIPS